jgi:hypothetical protein
MPTDSQFLDGTNDIQRLAILRAAEAQGTYISPLTDTCFKDATEDVQRLEILRAIEGISGGGGSGTVTSVTGGTGLTGGTITTSGTLAVSYGTSAGTAAEGNDSRLSDARIPTGSAGGDLTGTYPNPTVDGLQGTPVSNATPVNGQVLQYNGTSWVPGTIPPGGSGGGGVIYYLNFNTAADAPVTNIPQTPNASKELGIIGETTATSYLSPILSTGSYDFLASFVTDLNIPSATAIPAGIWDFNIFVESTTTNSSNQIRFKVEVLKYDGVNAPTLIATSNDVYIYDPAEINQQVASVVMPQTTILATDRILVYLYGRANQNNNRLTFHFGGNYPSHTHTTMPSVTGTGVVKVVNGVFQSPASTIVNADVSATAAIEVSKLSQATNRILGRTTAGTGSVEELSVAGNLTLASGTLTSLSPQIDIYTASGTWTKPVGAREVVVQCVAGGGGGGYGGKQTAGTAVFGGAGGGSGGYSHASINASELTDASYTITVGSGGTGGVGTTLTNATLGTLTSFAGITQGTLVRASAGGTVAGNGGTVAPTSGGAGAPAGNGGGAANITGTGGSGSGTNFAPSSGGAGGGITAAAVVGSLTGVFNGGTSGTNHFVGLISNGGVASATANGGSATQTTPRTLSTLMINGSGGGGGGACSFATGSGGNGANGTGYGSGGGGGGSTIGSGDRSNGGNGAPGALMITTYF